MSALSDVLPPKYRQAAYVVYAVLGVALGAVQVGFGAAESAQPEWLTVALAVYAFVGGAFGLTAASNIYSNRGGDDYQPKHAA